MKMQKIFMIDVELIERLKQEQNMSELMNGLLIKHYELEEKGPSKLELIAKNKDITRRIEAIEAKETKENEIKAKITKKQEEIAAKSNARSLERARLLKEFEKIASIGERSKTGFEEYLKKQGFQ